MSIFNEIHQYLAKEITEINDIIFSHLNGREELIKILSEHLIQAGGKRIRPILTILSFKMFNPKSHDGIKLATAIEFIHAATLLHDDVVDESTMRRFRPTANFIWGNKASILVGDFLLSQAFKILIEVKSISILETVAKATSNLIEGEVIQLQMLEDRNLLTKEQYDKVITAKTAELFGAACKIGGSITDQSEIYCNILHEFGMILGKIFQIADDLLDYLGNSQSIGKNIGDDFHEGKITLPLILLHNHAPESVGSEIIKIFQADSRTEEQFIYIQNLLKQYDIEEKILVDLSSLKLKAYNLIDKIESNDDNCKKYLTSLIDFSMTRIY